MPNGGTSTARFFLINMHIQRKGLCPRDTYSQQLDFPNWRVVSLVFSLIVLVMINVPAMTVWAICHHHSNRLSLGMKFQDQVYLQLSRELSHPSPNPHISTDVILASKVLLPPPSLSSCQRKPWLLPFPPKKQNLLITVKRKDQSSLSAFSTTYVGCILIVPLVLSDAQLGKKRPRKEETMKEKGCKTFFLMGKNPLNIFH